MPNPSAETIITLARGLLREESGSDVPAIGDTQMLQGVAEADREALRSQRRGGGNTDVDRALEGGDALIADTQINDSDGIAISDVTVTVDDTTDFDSSGAVVSWTNGMPDVWFYTGKGATTFTGVTGIGFPKLDNDSIQALYPMPSNFGKFRKSDEYGDGVQLNGQPLYYMEGPPSQGKFSTRSDGTTTFLWLPSGSTGYFSTLFDKSSNTINSLDDLVSLGEDWLYFYAWRSIELALFGRGDYEIVGLAQAKADKAKLDLLKDGNVGRMVRVRRYARMGDDDYNLALRENAL